MSEKTAPESRTVMKCSGVENVLLAKSAEAERPRATSFPGFLILPPPGGGKMRDPGYEVAF